MARRTRNEIIEALTAAQVAGTIRNVDFKDIADDAARAFERDGRAASDATDWPALRDRLIADSKFGDATSLPHSILHLAGWLKRTAKHADGADVARFRAVAEAWAPVAELLKAVKPMIVMGRAPSTKPAYVPAHAGTCQVCGRAIGAEHGKLAHHGYTRPGNGYQTASCMGARELPFEVSRDVLTFYIEAVRGQLADGQARLEQPQNGQPTIVRIERKYDNGRAVYINGAYVTHPVAYEPDHRDYERLRGIEIAMQESEIRQLNAEVIRQTARWNGWKPTTWPKA